MICYQHIKYQLEIQSYLKYHWQCTACPTLSVWTIKSDVSCLHLLYFFLKIYGFRDQMTGLLIFNPANIMIQLSGKGRGYLLIVWNGFRNKTLSGLQLNRLINNVLSLKSILYRHLRQPILNRIALYNPKIFYLFFVNSRN